MIRPIVAMSTNTLCESIQFLQHKFLNWAGAVVFWASSLDRLTNERWCHLILLEFAWQLFVCLMMSPEVSLAQRKYSRWLQMQDDSDGSRKMCGQKVFSIVVIDNNVKWHCFSKYRGHFESIKCIYIGSLNDVFQLF